jgi:hypothetical protein
VALPAHREDGPGQGRRHRPSVEASRACSPLAIPWPWSPAAGPTGCARPGPPERPLPCRPEPLTLPGPAPGPLGPVPRCSPPNPLAAYFWLAKKACFHLPSDSGARVPLGPGTGRSLCRWGWASSGHARRRVSTDSRKSRWSRWHLRWSRDPAPSSLAVKAPGAASWRQCASQVAQLGTPILSML